MMQQLAARLGNLIDPFKPADGPPPRTLWAFFKWCLAGTWPVLIVAFGVSALAGATEVISAFLLGAVIDSAVSTGPTTYFADNWPLLLVFVGFFLLIRPLLFGTSAAFHGMGGCGFSEDAVDRLPCHHESHSAWP